MRRCFETKWGGGNFTATVSTHGRRPAATARQGAARLQSEPIIALKLEAVSLDSTTVKVHPEGTGAFKKNGPQSIGKARGGGTPQIHLVAAQARCALRYALSPGPAGEAPQGRALLRAWGAAPTAACPLIMDRAYEGDETRPLALALGFSPVVPPKSNRLSPGEYDKGQGSPAPRSRAALPPTQRLPAPLLTLRQAGGEVPGLPTEHETGPWAPKTIQDKGGYWEDTVDRKLHRVDGDYLAMLNRRGWNMTDPDGTVHRTKDRAEFDKVARQEFAGWTFEQAKKDGVTNSVIELQPLEQIVTIFLPKNPRGSSQPTMLRQAKFSPRSGIGISTDGVRFFPPEPVHRIRAFQNIAPLDPFGGHTGFGHEYHYHRAPAVMSDDKSGKVIAQVQAASTTRPWFRRPLMGSLRPIPSIVRRRLALQLPRHRAPVPPEFPGDLRLVQPHAPQRRKHAAFFRIELSVIHRHPPASFPLLSRPSSSSSTQYARVALSL